MRRGKSNGTPMHDGHSQQCPRCAGTGACWDCQGRGKIECHFCGGQGCPDCDEAGVVTCVPCDGSGHCWMCQGSGVIAEPSA